MTDLGEALRAAIWAQALGAGELARVEAEMSERAVPAGGYVCRKGEPVNHWIGVFLLNQLNERLAQFIAMLEYERCREFPASA